jgi:hypothetical protein
MLAFHWSRGYLLTLVQRDQRRFAAREGEIQKRRDLLSRMIRECLLEGIERRDFRGVDVRVAAELFRGMIRAANELRRPADSPEELVRTIVDVFVGGIAKPPAV